MTITDVETLERVVRDPPAELRVRRIGEGTSGTARFEVCVAPDGRYLVCALAPPWFCFDGDSIQECVATVERAMEFLERYEQAKAARDW